MAVILKAAMDEQTLGKRTLARKLAETDGTIDGWRSQVDRILNGQIPRRDTAIRISRALGKPDGFLIPDDDPMFSTAMLGQLVELLEREPELRKMRPDLLRELATELKNLSTRLEALAASGQSSESSPGQHG